MTRKLVFIFIVLTLCLYCLILSFFGERGIIVNNQLKRQLKENEYELDRRNVEIENLKLQELEAAQVARVRSEVAYVVLNGNYALAAGLSVGKDSIAYESASSTAAKTYVNIIAVKKGNENDEEIKALVEVLKSDEIKNYIKETYDGAVVPFD